MARFFPYNELSKYQTKIIMKKLFVTLSMVAVFAACNSKPKETVVVVDTMAIKQKAILDEQTRVKAANDEHDKLVTERNNLAAERNRLAAERRRATRSENVGSSANTSSSGSGAASETPAKKGWSDAAKGTVIGAGAGAIAGALIDKNHAQGALIGGVLGGGTGYVVGRAKDRKTGRVVKKTTTPPNQ